MDTAPATSRPAAGSYQLARLTAQELLDGYRSRRFSPRDVIEDVIAALQLAQRTCNVMVTDRFEQARHEADQMTKAWRLGEPTGPLAGVPITVKDLLFVADLPAKAGAPSREDFVPTADAYVVERLKAAGAIVTCKTTTCESGYKLTADSPVSGITRNPWSIDRTSGGSSGGAAAAMAAGCGPLAIGTDGVGSIRVPSAFCGVFGLKPTFGLVSRSPGFFPPSWGSLAHTGPISRTVADSALLLNVIAGYDARDAACLPLSVHRFDPPRRSLGGMQIGYSADLGYAVVSSEVKSAFQAAIDVIADLGATLIPINPGITPDMLDRVLKPIAFTEQAASVGERGDEAFLRSDEEFRRVLQEGRSYKGVAYVEALHRRSKLRARFVELFQAVDAFLTPTVAVSAFAAGGIGVAQIDGRDIDRHLGWSPFSWPMNLAGLPAANVPCGFDRAGMPVGLQVVAPWMEERVIFQIATAFEATNPWAHHWPKLQAA
jgi:aspartyl-tRNA(Asn)/glutamyl-tRNA(Gln) amidotransferase subunit A